MLNFIQGTLLISNMLLILFSIVYCLLIIKKRRKEDSQIWICFVIACAFFFLVQFLSIVKEFFGTNTDTLMAILNGSFAVVILYAFVSKYDSISKK